VSTEVHLLLAYDIPGGDFGKAVAKYFGEELHQQLDDDPRRLKQVLETGEVVRSDGAVGKARPQGVSATSGAATLGRGTSGGAGVMKANCWDGRNKIEVRDVPDPAILNSRDAIVRITSTAICGSDLHLVDGDVPIMQDGDVLGHEFMGEVVEVGQGVDPDRLRVGDRVVVPFPIACGACVACGACAACAADLYSCCENTNPNASVAKKMFGHPLAGIFGYSHLTGGFAGGQAQHVCPSSTSDHSSPTTDRPTRSANNFRVMCRRLRQWATRRPMPSISIAAPSVPRSARTVAVSSRHGDACAQAVIQPPIHPGAPRRGPVGNDRHDPCRPRSRSAGVLVGARHAAGVGRSRPHWRADHRPVARGSGAVQGQE